jgi:hypothetical protein
VETWDSSLDLKRPARSTHSLSQAVLHGAASDNVGGVKLFVSTLQHALNEERHFALDDSFALPTKARSVIISGQELSPTHASLRSATAIVIHVGSKLKGPVFVASEVSGFKVVPSPFGLG